MVIENYDEYLDRVYRIAEERSNKIMNKLMAGFENADLADKIFNKYVRDRTIKRNTKKFYYNLVCDLYIELYTLFHIAENKEKWLEMAKDRRKI